MALSADQLEELRELVNLPGLAVHAPPDQMEVSPADEAEIIEQSGGAWTARLGERLAGELGLGWVSGAFAWESDLVYSVLALEG